MSDKKLLHSFTEGRARLLSFARRMLGADEDAEDALQEAFCRLWVRDFPVETQEDADKMAMRTVHNIGIDHIRKARRRSLTSVEPAEEPADGEERLAKERQEQQLKTVEKLISDALTPLQQRIIRQHDIEGKGYREISRKERMTEAAVRKQLSRARKKIRTLYSEHREDSEK